MSKQTVIGRIVLSRRPLTSSDLAQVRGAGIGTSPSEPSAPEPKAVDLGERLPA